MKNKSIQTLLSIGIFCLMWKGCNGLNMATLSKWSASSAIFWVLWSIEAAVMTWWLLDELKLQYLSVNPSVYIGWLWLFAALLLHLANWRIVAFILVGIGAIPLAIMGLFILVVLIAGPTRWN